MVKIQGENGHVPHCGKQIIIPCQHAHQRKISAAATIYQGDTVALQSVKRSLWLGCARDPCGDVSCLGLYFVGNDWIRCAGEVFQVYRADGPGEIHVGDLVGIFYPHKFTTWLGCSGSECQKSTCPGKPTATYGFATHDRWSTCSGEVFKIYANGKSDKTVINLGDDIFLYHVAANTWVSIISRNAIIRQLICPGSSRPPAPIKYDRCQSELFRIWKQ